MNWYDSNGLNVLVKLGGNGYSNAPRSNSTEMTNDSVSKWSPFERIEKNRHSRFQER